MANWRTRIEELNKRKESDKPRYLPEKELVPLNSAVCCLFISPLHLTFLEHHLFSLVLEFHIQIIIHKKE